MDGFALLGTLQAEPRLKPAKVNLFSSEFPETDHTNTRVFGTAEGGMMVTGKGDVEIVNSKGRSIRITEHGMDISDMKITGETQGHDNMFLMQNPFNNGEMFGVPIPDVLPLTVLTHNPTLNLPAIAATYVQIDGYKKLVKGIKNILEKVQDMKYG